MATLHLRLSPEPDHGPAPGAPPTPTQPAPPASALDTPPAPPAPDGALRAPAARRVLVGVCARGEAVRARGCPSAKVPALEWTGRGRRGPRGSRSARTRREARLPQGRLRGGQTPRPRWTASPAASPERARDTRASGQRRVLEAGWRFPAEDEERPGPALQGPCKITRYRRQSRRAASTRRRALVLATAPAGAHLLPRPAGARGKLDGACAAVAASAGCGPEGASLQTWWLHPVSRSAVSQPSDSRQSVSRQPVNHQPVSHQSVSHQPSASHQTAVSLSTISLSAISRQPAIRQPSACQPSVSDQPVSRQSARQSACQPSVSLSDISLSACQPSVSCQPSDRHQSVSRQTAVRQSVCQPSVSHQTAVSLSAVSQPSVGQPVSHQSVSHQSAVSVSTISQPSVCQPSVCQPSVSHQPAVSLSTIRLSAVSRQPACHPSACQPSVSRQSAIRQPVSRQSARQLLLGRQLTGDESQPCRAAVQWPQQPGRGQATARSQELHPGPCNLLRHRGRPRAWFSGSGAAPGRAVTLAGQQDAKRSWIQGWSQRGYLVRPGQLKTAPAPTPGTQKKLLAPGFSLAQLSFKM
ncbi:proline-rich protein 36-like [Lepus europaeus]|uniref:proline-rich protein 36-like n=1 Tax=Lepus europaeus TaxID=9983 RepID=UPI002B466D1A|nr:proline-rich protein 36-like [Lepus europaeus]